MSGFFGCVSRHECVGDVFYGTDYHSHLGTRRAGMAFYNGEKFVRSIHSLENGYFRNKFEEELPKFANSNMGIGVISDSESQPITITSHLGRFSVATVARIDNIKELTQELLDNKNHFSELSDSDINASELVAILVGKAETFKEGIEYAQSKIKGSCSMLIMTDTVIYAARDRFGRTPIIIGKNDKGYVCASESSSFTNLGYEYVRDIGPGEVVQISADGIRQVTPPGERMQICSFLWVYYGYPSAFYEGINVENARYRSGAAMAKRDADLQLDCAAGIPDSGIAHAIGYANQKGVEYSRPFVKYTPTWPRSFMPQNQKMRDLVAKMKLIPNKELTKDKRIAFLDDSIVRGTQLKDNVVKLIDAGVKEVHMRIACPPLIYPCKFLNFSTSRSNFDLYTRRVIRDMEGTSELSEEVLQEYVDCNSAKHKEMVNIMCKNMQLTSLKFQRLEDLVAAIGLPKCKLCTHCWDNSSYTE
ncbi:MAG: amidophosphoribosyltransferase [Candidatus Egerieousia sp.]|nr:amidophosphoribosyltransferase [bacterium]MDY3134727.1 amidophosphoribosyltransferase [Candidatus Egerieousia sp.]MDY3294174.1 amidophosphoribosyltransferase [Candidatus Egerieousia sp.]MDY5256195.1 amidophosphoribosyltransferase [Candidatus Egerieousia sp.]